MATDSFLERDDQDSPSDLIAEWAREVQAVEDGVYEHIGFDDYEGTAIGVRSVIERHRSADPAPWQDLEQQLAEIDSRFLAATEPARNQIGIPPTGWWSNRIPKVRGDDFNEGARYAGAI